MNLDLAEKMLFEIVGDTDAKLVVRHYINLIKDNSWTGVVNLIPGIYGTIQSKYDDGSAAKMLQGILFGIALSHASRNPEFERAVLADIELSGRARGENIIDYFTGRVKN